MDIQRIGRTIEKWSSGPSEISYTPKDIDPEGLKILREAGFVWDSRSLAFHRIRTSRQDGSYRSTIEYGFLREQKLLVHTTLREDERVGQLQRLRILIQSME